MGEKTSILAIFIDIIETVVVAAAIFVVLYIFLIQPHEVKGASMEPNFYDGQYILTDKITYRFNKPQRGDVIVFKSPTNPDVDFIKRIIGLPGEKVEIRNDHIVIYNSEHPNGFTLTEPYQITEPISGGSYLRDGKKVEVPADSYVVLGDNRTHSYDSREWGPITRKSIIGKAWLRYWPPNKISIIKGITY
ncbi:MAG: signal peptidase I [Candidatus Woykebacteria bacterium RBG_13_40_15]|uniref:Signal peptidase I n=1 Tax=Candidatus Woykebacteria bacterium RBG_13_40_15 TaxID=1802593 RepID=A0A1G1W9V1_9BACT|nr:MAG: signal peptidase I [Candidatus Woykebacteria bacterium RBG_13_40_15]